MYRSKSINHSDWHHSSYAHNGSRQYIWDSQLCDALAHARIVVGNFLRCDGDSGFDIFFASSCSRITISIIQSTAIER